MGVVRRTDVVSAMAVRRATFEDLPQLVELMHEFYAESGYSLDRTWAAAAFTHLLANPQLGAVWVMEFDGVAAGHVVLTVHFSMEFGGVCGIIDDLFVRPAFRRKGAARRALDVVLRECSDRGCLALSVDVGAGNHPAIALYRTFALAEGTDGRKTLRLVLQKPRNPEGAAGTEQ
jgi:GNAT superfamily N-acetyltransferase